MPQSPIPTGFFKQFKVSGALCTMSDGILLPDKVNGEFEQYLYGLQNGKQVLLGHHPFPALNIGDTVSLTQYVFVSREDGTQRRQLATWEALREYLSQGWVIGTDRYPGVKLWLASKGHNLRRPLETVYVFSRE